MRPAATRRHDHVPVLNNCGPAPMAVYTTGKVGIERSVSLLALMQSFLVPVGVPWMHDSWQTVDGGAWLHPGIVDATLVAALVVTGLADADTAARVDECTALLLETAPARASRALEQRCLQQFAMLGAHFPALGSGCRFRGLAQLSATNEVHPVPADLPWIPTDAGTPRDLLVRLWLLLAFAHVIPPVLLHSRKPSLQHFTRGACLSLRWFGDAHGAVRAASHTTGGAATC